MTVTLELLQLPRGPTRVQWRRSARARRVSLRIDPGSSSVVVTLPGRMARARGLAMLTVHAGWVDAHLAALPVALTFADGALIPVAGQPHRIRHLPASDGSAWLQAGEIHVPGNAAEIARRVTDLLRSEALRRLGALVAEKCAMAGLSVRRVTVKDTRTRWGSCTPGGTLMFCWRLVMAPSLVQDYAVAHEVAHLRHMNPWRKLLGAGPRPHPASGRRLARGSGLDGAGLLRTG